MAIATPAGGGRRCKRAAFCETNSQHAVALKTRRHRNDAPRSSRRPDRPTAAAAASPSPPRRRRRRSASRPAAIMRKKPAVSVFAVALLVGGRARLVVRSRRSHIYRSESRGGKNKPKKKEFFWSCACVARHWGTTRFSKTKTGKEKKPPKKLCFFCRIHLNPIWSRSPTAISDDDGRGCEHVRAHTHRKPRPPAEDVSGGRSAGRRLQATRLTALMARTRALDGKNQASEPTSRQLSGFGRAVRRPALTC